MAEVYSSEHSHHSSLRERFTTQRERIKQRTRKYPIFVFLFIIIVVLAILSVAKAFQPTPEEKQEQAITKDVEVYSIGEGPQATFQAKVEKTGVIQIVAQAGGIVQQINKQEGETVLSGQQIVSLSTNYQGGTAQSVQRQIAQTQYQNVLDTSATQTALLNDQREIAKETYNNAERQREIQQSSLNDVQDSLDQNEQQLNDVKSAIGELRETNPLGIKDEQFNQIEDTATQLLSGGVDQLRSQQQSLAYQASDDEPPARLAELQKESTLKQLTIQEESQKLNKEVSRLQLQLAYVNEAVMYPASPFMGTVQKIFVKKGQSVNPGTVLATVAANETEATATVLVPQAVAEALQQGQPSILQINDKEQALLPYYVSTEATDGQLFSVYYTIPQEQLKSVIDGEYIAIRMPIGMPDTGGFTPIIPIDSVYQTNDTASVLVANNGKAQEKRITVSDVFGDYVKVTNGLSSGDQIILDRNVIAGDTVTMK